MKKEKVSNPGSLYCRRQGHGCAALLAVPAENRSRLMESDTGSGKILGLERHHPSTRTCDPDVRRTCPIRIPRLSLPSQSNGDAPFDSFTFDEHVAEVHEWINLVSLDSPRVHEADTIDPYLCRYDVSETAGTSRLVCVKWQGLLPAKWVTDLWVQTL